MLKRSAGRYKRGLYGREIGSSAWPVIFLLGVVGVARPTWWPRWRIVRRGWRRRRVMPVGGVGGGGCWRVRGRPPGDWRGGAGGGKLAVVRAVLAGEIPLLGREAEMGRIIARLRGREPVAFVLAGAAGVGKTRLATEVSTSAAGLGFATAQAVGSRAAAAIPFGPFAPFLPESGHAPG